MCLQRGIIRLINRGNGFIKEKSFLADGGYRRMKAVRRI